MNAWTTVCPCVFSVGVMAAPVSSMSSTGTLQLRAEMVDNRWDVSCEICAAVTHRRCQWRWCIQDNDELAECVWCRLGCACLLQTGERRSAAIYSAVWLVRGGMSVILHRRSSCLLARPMNGHIMCCSVRTCKIQ